MSSILFIGGGNMADAILSGCLDQKMDSKSYGIVEINAERRDFLNKKYVNQSVNIFSQCDYTVRPDIILLAVKPQQLSEITSQLIPYLEHNKKILFISIMAGIRLDSLRDALNGYTQIIRTMPNMAALVHAGITGMVALPEVTSEIRDQATQLMQSVGDVLWLDKEEQLDAVTAVSGSGPAYVFYFIEALQKAGESLGLTTEQSKQLALKTFEGASHLAALSSDSAATLREKVTSKGGTTEAALTHLNQKNVNRYFIEAVEKAAERAKALGLR